MDNQNYSHCDLITILAFFLGLENLQENREQSKQNNVQTANDKQAEYLLKKSRKR